MLSFSWLVNCANTTITILLFICGVVAKIMVLTMVFLDCCFSSLLVRDWDFKGFASAR